MSVLAGPNNADTHAETYRVYPTGWTAARAAGLRIEDHFSVRVERLHRGTRWLILRGGLFYDPERAAFVEGFWYAAKTPARFAYDRLDTALETARRLAAESTNPRGRTFAQIAEEWAQPVLPEGQRARPASADRPVLPVAPLTA